MDLEITTSLPEPKTLTIGAYVEQLKTPKDIQMAQYLLKYSEPKPNDGLVEQGMIHSKDYLLSGPFPEGFYHYTIIDFGQRKELVSTERTVEGNQVMITTLPKEKHSWKPYPLKTEQETRRQLLHQAKHSAYNFPMRLVEQLDLIMYVNGEKCRRSQLSPAEAQQLLNQMTPEERQRYQSETQYNVTPSLYPTKEKPIRLRIVGSDDGAFEGCFETIKDAQMALKEPNFSSLNITD